MKKIVLASDSYKGCFSSKEVALAASGAVALLFPDCEIVMLSVADSVNIKKPAPAFIREGFPDGWHKEAVIGGDIGSCRRVHPRTRARALKKGSF